MANTKISQLPSWSGTAADLRWFVMNNSGETQTFKYSGYSSPLKFYGNNINNVNDTNPMGGSYSILLGGENNLMSSTGGSNSIIGGEYNSIKDSSGDAFIGGGYGNIISGGTNYSSIVGGQFNINDGNYSSIMGGRYNHIFSSSTEYSTIVGSYSSKTRGDYSHLFGGVNNEIDSPQAIIFGGRENYIAPQSDNSEMIGSRNSVISGQSQDTTLINTIETNTNGYDRIVMLGTSGRTATASDTTYTEKLKVMGKLVEVTDGTNTISDNIGSLIVGKNNTVTQDKYNIVLGESNSVTGAGAPGIIGNIVNGVGNSVSTYSTGNFVTGGYNSLPAQGQNFRMGNNATINGGGNFSMGEQAGISGNYSFVFGNYSSSNASNNFTIGDNNVNSGTQTYNLGTLNNTSASYSVAIGGYDNDLSGGNAQGIFVGDTCDISSSEPYNTIVNGRINVISGNAKYGTIINGDSNSITGGTNVTMIGTSGRTATTSETTYVENLHIYRTPSTTVQPISSGTTFTCNLNNGGKAQYSLTGNTTIDITNVRDGQSFMVKTQTNGNYTITWTATGYTFVFEGGIKDPGNTTTDIFVFEVFGTTIYGNRRHNYS